MILQFWCISARKDIGSMGKPPAKGNETTVDNQQNMVNKTMAICNGMAESPQTVCDYELQTGAEQATFDAIKVLLLVFIAQLE